MKHFSQLKTLLDLPKNLHIEAEYLAKSRCLNVCNMYDFVYSDEHECNVKNLDKNVKEMPMILRGGADAVDFRTHTKIKIYAFNFKDPSF